MKAAARDVPRVEMKDEATAALKVLQRADLMAAERAISKAACLWAVRLFQHAESQERPVESKRDRDMAV